MDIPLSAKVECADGTAGESTAVIVNPATQKLTQFVVRDKSSSSPVERRVPVEQVVSTTPALIRLRCTTAEMTEMESVEDGAAANELVVRHGTRVEATDGHVGKVRELVVDPDSDDITHLMLQEGHAWGEKEVTLPISAINRVDDDTVYLDLDKKAIGLLPSIPLKGHDSRIELIAKVFDNPDQAFEALEFVEDLHRRKTLKILNAAVLVKDEDGTTSLKDTRDIEPKKGRLLGAVTGGLIGLVGGPAGVVVGALVGAGTGHVAAKKVDFGFSDKFLKELQEHLQPGSSALIVLVEDTWKVSMSESLKDDKGIVLQQTLTDELVKQFMEADEEEA
jgi:uncharacterized membrane protein/sporulation protein YlmC with PRC-barrel domain